MNVRRIEFRYLDAPDELPRLPRMSFFLTTEQVLSRQKTVTRRAPSTWTRLQAGDRVIAVRRTQGLRRGERHEVLGLLEVVSVRVELLDAIDVEDVAREGFPDWSVGQFVEMFRNVSRAWGHRRRQLALFAEGA